MIKKLSALFALLEALSLTANAGAPLPANFIQNVTLDLSVVAPGKTSASGLTGTVSTATINTLDAIETIGEATSNKFSAAAQILVVTPITYYTNPVVTMSKGKSVTNLYVFGYLGNPAFEIKDGTKVLSVGGFINVGTVNSNTFIQSYTQTATGSYTAFKSYRVRTISVANTALEFTGQGLVESTLVNVTVAPGVVVFGIDDKWTSFTGVASNGEVNGVLYGTISGTYLKVE